MVQQIIIPLLNSTEKIVIFTDELNEYPEENLLMALRGELAPLRTWLDCAVEYHRQQMDDKFYLVLNTIVEALVDESNNIIYMYTAIVCLMCSLFLSLFGLII